MAQAPLITLANVTAYLNSSGVVYPSSSNPLFQRLIGAVSTFAGVYLSRPIAPQTFTETYNGNGRYVLTLRQQPVIVVHSVTVSTTAIAARPMANQAGYVNDDASVSICGGHRFCYGRQNVTIVYDAGYLTSDVAFVPSTPAVSTGLYAVDTNTLSRPWNSAFGGVTYSSTGSAFTLVTTAPTLAGTYQLTTDALGNTSYVFAAADAGAAITIVYGYTPEDIAQALLELVCERFKARNRIGEMSQNIGQGQVVAFSQLSMGNAVRELLNQYRNVVPIES